jgi:hypothetical protein
VLFISSKSIVIIDGEIVSFEIVNSDIFDLSVINVSPTDVKTVKVSKLKVLLVVVFSSISVELTTVLNLSVFDVSLALLTLEGSELTVNVKPTCNGVRSFETVGSVKMLSSVGTEVSTATVDSRVVILSSGVDENLCSFVIPIVLDNFFVKSVKVKYFAFNETVELSFDFLLPNISVTISSPVVDGVMEGISSVLFTSLISEAVIEDEMVSVTTADSDIFGVSATNVVLNGAEFVEFFELLNVSVVALFRISVELVTTKDVSFDRSVVDLYSVEIKLAEGSETNLFSVKMFSCIADEFVADDEVKMMGAVKFSGVEVENVSLLTVGTLYSLLIDVSTTSVESNRSTSVILEVSVVSLVDLSPFND